MLHKCNKHLLKIALSFSYNVYRDTLFRTNLHYLSRISVAFPMWRIRMQTDQPFGVAEFRDLIYRKVTVQFTYTSVIRDIVASRRSRGSDRFALSRSDEWRRGSAVILTSSNDTASMLPGTATSSSSTTVTILSTQRGKSDGLSTRRPRDASSLFTLR